MDAPQTAVLLLAAFFVQACAAQSIPFFVMPTKKVVMVRDINPSLFEWKNQTGYYPSLMDALSDFGGTLKFAKPYLVASTLSEAVDLVSSGAADVLAAPVEVNDKYDDRINFTQPVFGSELVLIMKKDSKPTHVTVLGAANVMQTVLDQNFNDLADKIIARLRKDNPKKGPTDNIYIGTTGNVGATFDAINLLGNTAFLGRKAAMLNMLPNSTGAGTRWPNLVIDNAQIGTLFSTLGVKAGNTELLSTLKRAIGEVDRRGCLREVFWQWFGNADWLVRTKETFVLGRDTAKVDPPKVHGTSPNARNCNVPA